MVTRRRSVSLGLSASLALAGAATPTATSAATSAATAAAAPTPIDCRYERPQRGDGARAWHAILLPGDGMFRPLLADQKQARIAASYRAVHFRGEGVPAEEQGDEIDAGIVIAGGELPIWAVRAAESCDGGQFELLGATYSQFNLTVPSTDLVNTDFVAGFQGTARFGFLSGRLRFFHQSSHLGDEFLLNNPEVDRTALGFEALDGLLSVDGSWWRVYGGGGYLLRTEPDLEPAFAQWGVELRGPRWQQHLVARMGVEPVAAVDFNVLEERAWRLTTSLAAGVELTGAASAPRFGILFTYLRGFIPFGQFFNTEKIDSYGIELQYTF